MFSELNGGRYTLFLPASEPMPLGWDSPSLAVRYQRRAERLLNICLRGYEESTVLSHLLFLLRLALTDSDNWTETTWDCLQSQLMNCKQSQLMDEFPWARGAFGFSTDACKCIWSDVQLDVDDHSTACQRFRKEVGVVFGGSSLGSLVEKIEDGDPVLRARAQR